MEPRIDDIYKILREWAIERTPRSYSDLSNVYHKRTGDWLEPHGSWDKPLGVLNNRLAQIDAPAISAIVILQEKNEPGGNFWGCSPNVPKTPKDEMSRLSEWNRIINDVCSYEWPELLHISF